MIYIADNKILKEGCRHLATDVLLTIEEYDDVQEDYESRKAKADDAEHEKQEAEERSEHFYELLEGAEKDAEELRGKVAVQEINKELLETALNKQKRLNNALKLCDQKG